MRSRLEEWLSVPTGRRGHARVAVLTVIEEEVDAVRTALNADHEVGNTGVFTPVPPQGNPVRLPVVVARCASRSNIPAQSSATRLIEQWQPEVVILAGVAGGIARARSTNDEIVWEGPEPGDIVVAEYVHYAEFTKNEPLEARLRYFPIDQPTSTLVQAHADSLRSPPHGVDPWHQGLGPYPAGRPPNVHIGEIIAVEGIAGDPEYTHQKRYLERFDHALAVDMESAGVARALHEARADIHYNPRWMCVRAISDHVYAPTTLVEEGAYPALSNSEERRRWKAYAAPAAGQFVRRLAERLLSEAREASPGDPGAEAYGWT